MSEIGSIVCAHCPGRFLLLQILQHDIGPSSAEHIKHLATIDALVKDHHQSPVVAAHQPSEAHCAPLPRAPHRPVTNIPQAAPEPPDSVR
jgi:hypothetical protein